MDHQGDGLCRVRHLDHVLPLESTIDVFGHRARVDFGPRQIQQQLVNLVTVELPPQLD
jgi:hypothetical protein